MPHRGDLEGWEIEEDAVPYVELGGSGPTPWAPKTQEDSPELFHMIQDQLESPELRETQQLLLSLHEQVQTLHNTLDTHQERITSLETPPTQPDDSSTFSIILTSLASLGLGIFVYLKRRAKALLIEE